MENKSLIFIPDISGFTKFVNATEIEHSNIIISSLLENIINRNQLNLKVSEIEGDAVLFYRFGTPPKVKEVIDQARNMFVDAGDTMGGRFRTVNTPVRLTACAGTPSGTPPLLGQHTLEVLGSIGGLGEEELARMQDEGVV